MLSLSALAVISMAIAGPSFAADGAIKVGYYDTPPLAWNDKGVMRGLFVELLDNIASEEHWSIQYIPESPDSGLRQLEDGKLDLLIPFPKLRIGSERIRTNDETIISTWAQLFASSDLKVSSILDVKGRSIGVVGSSTYNHELRDIANGFDLKCTIVEHKTSTDVLQAVEKGWIELGVVDQLASLNDLNRYPGAVKTSVMFAPTELKFASNPSEIGLLQAIDYHLAELKKNHGSVYYVALNKVYFDVSDPNSFRFMQLILISTVGLVLLAAVTILLMRVMIQRKSAEITTTTKELSEKQDRLAQTEEALNVSSELLEETFASLMDAILIASGLSLKFVKCNAAASDCFNYGEHELLGMTPLDLFPDSSIAELKLAEIQSLLNQYGRYFGTHELCRRNKQVFPAEIAVTAILNAAEDINLLVIIVRDITERTRAEEALRKSDLRLRQSQKMEALGTLAGGIAHDFNNILTPIVGYADLIAMKASDDSLLSNQINQILKASERAKALIGQIMTFSRQREQERQQMRVGPLVKEGMKLLRAGIPANIELKYQSTAENDWILADPTEIHQVLMNLCTNSTYAMKDTGGSIDVSLSDFDGQLSGYCIEPPKEDLNYLKMSIADTGVGIPSEILDRIFDPFFTTKAPGEGTGIGLAVVHGIITACGGTLAVESMLGKGTTFHIFFPLAEKKVEAQTTSYPETSIGKGECVVVVDDEEMIRQMAFDFLSSLNFMVRTFDNGQDAYSYIEKNLRNIDIVITDQSMPKLTGIELSSKLHVLSPELPIVLCTGFNEAANAENIKSYGIRELVMKPYTLGKMAVIIRSLLDEHRGTNGNGKTAYSVSSLLIEG